MTVKDVGFTGFFDDFPARDAIVSSNLTVPTIFLLNGSLSVLFVRNRRETQILAFQRVARFRPTRSFTFLC
jgi:hypothetical protein